MTLWQRIKEDAGFGLFDHIGTKVAFTAAQWELWWAMPLCMLVGMLLTPIALAVTLLWVLVHLCLWVYRRACAFGRSLHERDRPGVAHFAGLLLAVILSIILYRCT